MAVLVPRPGRGGKVDGFIDDLINIFVDTPENCARQPHVVPLAMHVTSRPHAGDNEEPVPRRPIPSLPKLVAEGRPEEVQTVLGWTLNTRRIEIALPSDKYLAWLADIRGIRESGNCSHAALDTPVGRLNHTAYVLPNARHFLSRIRATLGRTSSGRMNRRSIKISPEALADLALWEEFLADAHTGRGVNEPPGHSDSQQDLLVRRVSLRHRRLQLVWEGLADQDPASQPHLRSQRNQQPPRVRWNGDKHLAIMPGGRIVRELHPRYRRQYVSPWMAAQHVQDRPILASPQCPSDGGPEGGTTLDDVQVLPGIPARERGTQRGS